MLERIRTYFERRSADRAAQTLYNFMVLNGHHIDDDTYDNLCRVRDYLLEKGN